MRINNIILSENMPVESNVLWIKPDEKGYTLLVNGSNGYVPLIQNSNFFDKLLPEFGIIYNSGTGFYELNGLTDLTEDDIITYLVEYSANTAPIEIAVHPDVYAKIQDASNTEWHKLIEDGAAKQISFVNGTSALDFNELEL